MQLNKGKIHERKCKVQCRPLHSWLGLWVGGTLKEERGQNTTPPVKSHLQMIDTRNWLKRKKKNHRFSPVYKLTHWVSMGFHTPIFHSWKLCFSHAHMTSGPVDQALSAVCVRPWSSCWRQEPSPSWCPPSNPASGASGPGASGPWFTDGKLFICSQAREVLLCWVFLFCSLSLSFIISPPGMPAPCSKCLNLATGSPLPSELPWHLVDSLFFGTDVPPSPCYIFSHMYFEP